MKKSIKVSFLFLSLVCIGLIAGRMQFFNAQDKIHILEGEQLTYDVYFKRIKVGTSVLTLSNDAVYAGKDVYHIKFVTTFPLQAFSDTENIYVEKDTFLPLMVSRKIRRAGILPQTIEEVYDQENFTVSITKKGRIFSRSSTIQKDRPIHNAIALPYYYRFQQGLTEQPVFQVSLPTADFDVVFKGTEEISTGIGKKEAYVFSSIPEKFRFYLSADDKRIPLKIESLTTLNYSFILNERRL